MTTTGSILLPTHWLATHRREAIAARVQRARAALPAYFSGIQDGFGVVPDIELWTLTRDVGIHPAGSTLSRQTIEAHGYTLPRPLTDPKHAA
ncbi:MAG: hypothetical protein KAX37_07205 [Opitutaceae bacterium]|nr:hypothetical protein [Opitutaceae bacterium]